MKDEIIQIAIGIAMGIAIVGTMLTIIICL
jgi:hypothetical protein